MKRNLKILSIFATIAFVFGFFFHSSFASAKIYYKRRIVWRKTHSVVRKPTVELPAAQPKASSVVIKTPTQTSPPTPSPTVTNTPIPPQSTGLGRHFIDADFGSQLIQITNGNDGKACYNEYSYWPSFNKDSTKFFIVCDEKGILYNFDPVNFNIISKQDLFTSLPGGGMPSIEDAIWSGTSANILYVHQGLKIWAYDVANRTYSLVKDFSQELQGQYLFQMSKSIDDNRFAFTLEDGQSYSRVGYMVWDKAANKIIYRQSVSVLDEVQIDKSGKYLVVKTGLSGKGALKASVVDLQTGNKTDLLDGAPDFAPGHSDNGQGTLLAYDNWNNLFSVRSLSSSKNYKTILSLGNDWAEAAHISFLANDENWALISLFTPGGLSAGKYHDEIILTSTDGSGKVKELAKTHSVVLDYYDQPKANISRDGKFVIFTSNWDGARRDAYLLKINP